MSDLHVTSRLVQGDGEFLHVYLCLQNIQVFEIIFLALKESCIKKEQRLGIVQCNNWTANTYVRVGISIHFRQYRQELHLDDISPKQRYFHNDTSLAKTILWSLNLIRAENSSKENNWRKTMTWIGKDHLLSVQPVFRLLIRDHWISTQH